MTGHLHLLLLDHDARIPFGRHQNTAFEDGAYHVPSGHLEAGESVAQALIREAKEEVGVSIAPGHVEFTPAGCARAAHQTRRGRRRRPSARGRPGQAVLFETADKMNG